MPGTDAFSQSYAEARGKFLAAAEGAGRHVESHIHPMRGRDDEALAMDVVRDGPPDAARVLLISSACHGVEGFCGSGVQVALLRDADWRAHCRDAGVAVLYVHALNPYGFSWWRRGTHENVDLNRNFRDFSHPLPANPGYDEIAALLVPPTWPPSDAVKARVQQFIAERGMPALQAAVSGGQHEHPEGLYFAGRNPTWSEPHRAPSCCATMRGAASGSAGSTCTRGSARATTASASTPAPTMWPRWRAPAHGGAPRSPPSTTAHRARA